MNIIISKGKKLMDGDIDKGFKQMEKIDGKKFLLLILYTPLNDQENYPISGRTRLMKMGFIFKKEIKFEFLKQSQLKFDMPIYFSWKYGPFSKELLTDLEFLKNQGYIIVKNSSNIPLSEELEEYEFWIDEDSSNSPVEYEQEDFLLSENKGINKARNFWQELTQNQQKILIDFKHKSLNTSLHRILEYVYKKYKKDGYIDNSVIKDKFF